MPDETDKPQLLSSPELTQIANKFSKGGEASKPAGALRWLQPSEAILRREFPSVVCAQDNGCGQF